jgi:transposase
MSVELNLGELAQRLVLRRKRDGRNIYDAVAKRELIEACMRPGVVVAKVARECGVNANQLSTWIRAHQSQATAAGGEVVELARPAFVPVQIQAAPAAVQQPAADVGLQARLPNGVVVDLRGCDMQQACSVLEMLGRLRCFASTKG